MIYTILYFEIYDRYAGLQEVAQFLLHGEDGQCRVVSPTKNNAAYRQVLYYVEANRAALQDELGEVSLVNLCNYFIDNQPELDLELDD